MSFFRSALLSLAFVVPSAVWLTSCGNAEVPAPAGETAPSNAPRVDLTTAGAIRGQVKFDGTPPPNPAIRMSSDPACEELSPGEPTDPIILVDAGGLRNVFVYVKNGLGTWSYDEPSTPVTLDQAGCRFSPRVFGVRVGQPVDIVNSDPTLHNVHAFPEHNDEFNVGQKMAGASHRRTFTQPEVMVPFKCDVHNWMRAWAGVLDHPYFAVSGEAGRFEIPNLPPGTYTVEAWHERLGTATQQVTVPEKGTTEVTFTFKAS